MAVPDTHLLLAMGGDGLLDGKASGRPSKLDDGQRQATAPMIESGPIPAIHGVVRWRLIDLAQWLFEGFRHHDRQADAQSGASCHGLPQTLGSPAIWFQDEARIGPPHGFLETPPPAIVHAVPEFIWGMSDEKAAFRCEVCCILAKRRKRECAIEGATMGTVRFLLALCVVVTHGPGSELLGVSLLSGITAVQAFYIISGFLITMIINERKEYQIPSNFYVSRYLRLWPAYAVVATLSLVFVNWHMIFSELSQMNWLTIIFVWFSNLTLFFQDWLLFLRVDNGQLFLTAEFGAAPPPQQIVGYLLVPQCWTLGIELTFYLFAPFICRRWGAVLGLFLFGLSVRFAIAGWRPPAQDPWLYRFAPAEMMLFASGGLSYFGGRLLYARVPKWTPPLAAIFALVILASIILGNVYVTPMIQSEFGWWSQSLYLMNLPILFLVALACPLLFYGSRKNRADDILGELSYPMYISHLFILHVVIRYVPASLNFGNVTYVVSVVMFSFLLFLLITLPVDRFRSRFGARVPGLRESNSKAFEPAFAG
jgi:peptidoglycan/LPS O-acetylase OafA/YrhL